MILVIEDNKIISQELNSFFGHKNSAVEINQENIVEFKDIDSLANKIEEELKSVNNYKFIFVHRTLSALSNDFKIEKSFDAIEIFDKISNVILKDKQLIIYSYRDVTDSVIDNRFTYINTKYTYRLHDFNFGDGINNSIASEENFKEFGKFYAELIQDVINYGLSSPYLSYASIVEDIAFLNLKKSTPCVLSSFQAIIDGQEQFIYDYPYKHYYPKLDDLLKHLDFYNAHLKFDKIKKLQYTTFDFEYDLLYDEKEKSCNIKFKDNGIKDSEYYVPILHAAIYYFPEIPEIIGSNSITYDKIDNEYECKYKFKYVLDKHDKYVGNFHCVFDIRENNSPKDNEIKNYFNLLRIYSQSAIARYYKKKALHLAVQAQKAAIMGRNMSHNIGSHVLYYLKESLSDYNSIYTNGVLKKLDYDEKKGYWKFENDKDLKNFPFLFGLGKFINYLQERQDFIATISTDFLPSLMSINFKDAIFDEINYDLRAKRHSDSQNFEQTNFILKYIAKSEDFDRDEISINFKSWNGEKESSTETEDEKLLRQLKISVPGGTVGRQAFMSIFENVIRNACKHGGKSRLQEVNGKKQFVLTMDVLDFHKSNQAVLQTELEDYYFKNTNYDPKDYYVVTLVDNFPKKASKILNVKDKLDEPLIDTNGNPNNEAKGLKEIKISAAWLIRKDYDDNDLSYIRIDSVDINGKYKILEGVHVKSKKESNSQEANNSVVEKEDHYLRISFLVKKSKERLVILHDEKSVKVNEDDIKYTTSLEHALLELGIENKGSLESTFAAWNPVKDEDKIELFSKLFIAEQIFKEIREEDKEKLRYISNFIIKVKENYSSNDFKRIVEEAEDNTEIALKKELYQHELAHFRKTKKYTDYTLEFYNNSDDAQWSESIRNSSIIRKYCALDHLDTEKQINERFIDKKYQHNFIDNSGENQYCFLESFTGHNSSKNWYRNELGGDKKNDIHLKDKYLSTVVAAEAKICIIDERLYKRNKILSSEKYTAKSLLEVIPSENVNFTNTPRTRIMVCESINSFHDVNIGPDQINQILDFIYNKHREIIEKNFNCKDTGSFITFLYSNYKANSDKIETLIQLLNKELEEVNNTYNKAFFNKIKNVNVLNIQLDEKNENTEKGYYDIINENGVKVGHAENFGESGSQYNGLIQLYDEYDYVTIHQGLIDKILPPDKLSELPVISCFKKEVKENTKQSIYDQNLVKNKFIHSGRSRPAHLPKDFGFVMFSQLQHAYNDSKKVLFDLFNNTLIKKNGK